MSNRVEELESKVAELQAAVNGLTEELVETKERVRLLEDQVEVDLSTGTRPVGHGSPSDGSADAEPAAESNQQSRSQSQSKAKAKPGESPAQTESRSETSDNPGTDADFIDADSQEFDIDDAADDEDKSDEGQSEDEADTTDDSDIIVA
ncbi:DUF7518 family protein [Halopelagius fulvigenes]|uniref:BZIP transcription factor n=1 Tax=Halopelagius fulvigenes TaxID=1198324 RepID=A0ABD5U3J8_9EURY